MQKYTLSLELILWVCFAFETVTLAARLKHCIVASFYKRPISLSTCLFGLSMSSDFHHHSKQLYWCLCAGICVCVCCIASHDQVCRFFSFTFYFSESLLLLYRTLTKFTDYPMLFTFRTLNIRVILASLASPSLFMALVGWLCSIYQVYEFIRGFSVSVILNFESQEFA